MNVDYVRSNPKVGGRRGKMDANVIRKICESGSRVDI